MTSSSTTRRPAPRKTENLSHPPKVTEHSRPAREKNPAPRKRSQVEEDEDAYILYLESELKKRGSKRKEEDGLDGEWAIDDLDVAAMIYSYALVDLMNFVSDLGTSDLVVRRGFLVLIIFVSTFTGRGGIRRRLTIGVRVRF